MKKFIFMMLAFALVTLPSCKKAEKKFKNKNILNICYQFDPPAIDPRKTGDFFGSAFSFKLFCGLNQVLPNGDIGPGIAKNFDLSEDKTTYTFYLRDAKWSDGTPISAYDFEYSWKSIINPDFPSITSKLFYCIKNAEKAANRQLSIDEIGVKALDAKTLQVTLEYPTPYFLGLTAFCAYFPAPYHILKDNPAWDIRPDNKFVNSGPFKLVRWLPKDIIVLEKNEHFWNASNVLPDQIIIHIISDENTALRMFEDGKLDFLGTPVCPIPYHAQPFLQQNLTQIPIAGSNFITFNVKKKPFNNKHMRKAFSYALDRKLIVDSITYSNQSVSTRIIPPPFHPNLESFQIPNNNPELAKKHFQLALDELKMKREDIDITLFFPTTFLEKKVAETIQAKIFDLFGVLIKLEEKDYQSHMTTIRSHEHQIALAKWIFQYEDVMNIFARFREDEAPVNYSSWYDKQFVALLDKINQTRSSTQRDQWLMEAEKILIEELPVAPLFHLNFLMISKEGMNGVVIGKIGSLHFEYVRKEVQ